MIQMQLSTSLHSLGTKDKIKHVDERKKDRKHIFIFIIFFLHFTVTIKLQMKKYCFLHGVIVVQ